GYARENTRTLQARNLMTNMVEQLHTLPTSATWRTNPDSTANDLDDNTTGDYNITNGLYGIRWNIVGDVVNNTQDIKIFINWTTTGGRQKSISSQFTLIRS
ncbi:MAG TPA: hypothetical protein VMF29_02240, partial [Candidatus Edwardsbacteria bacterium]|nr:hypothetical protein [Candidatus Edwardsbacteria bacterium]